MVLFSSLASLETFGDDLRPRRPARISPRSQGSSPPVTGDHSPTSQDSSDSNGIFTLAPTTSMTKLPVERTRSPSNSGTNYTFSSYSSSSVSSTSSTSNARRNTPALFDSSHVEKMIREVSRNYVINIEKFLSKDCGEHHTSFREFLSSECNLSPLEFYEKVTEFKISEQKMELARHLVKNYVKEQSNHEINIANNVREVILKEYKECKEKKTIVSSNIFEKACKEVKYDLNDSFTRFVSSDHFNKLILKKFNLVAKNKSLDTISETLELIFESIGSLSPLSSPKMSSHSINKSLHNIVNSQITVTPPKE